MHHYCRSLSVVAVIPGILDRQSYLGAIAALGFKSIERRFALNLDSKSAML
ncbi:MAG: hypothetical protein VKJ46_09795 [Leptolyngbyaceae bacterium]|nr:hypothetical protein [Leptolyngbyaceae bacterium]